MSCIVAVFFLLRFIHKTPLHNEHWNDDASLAGPLIAVLLISRFFCPRALLPLYIFWVGTASLLGRLVGPVILTLVYFGVLTPVALISRLLGKKWLETGNESARWKPLPPHNPKNFEKPY